MITNGIVINDLDTFDKIVSFAQRKKDYFANYYRDEYAKLIDTLSRYASRCRENLSHEGFNQNLIDFSLRTITMFKTILYLYLRQNNPTISGKEMEFITSVLELLDGWISEDLNTEEYYIQGIMYYRINGDLKTVYYS